MRVRLSGVFQLFSKSALFINGLEAEVLGRHGLENFESVLPLAAPMNE